MFFLCDSDSSSDEEIRNNLIVDRRLVREKFSIFDMPDEKFESYFRLNKQAFQNVLEIIEPHLKKGKRSTFVPNTIKLAATLIFLNGSCQLSVGSDFNLGLSQSVMSRTLSEILDVMERKVCSQWINFDMTEDERDEAKSYFFEKTGFPGVIGCVDGTHIKIQAPNKQDQHFYFNNKGYFSLNAMIISDHKMRIRFLDARHPGSNHDSLIWDMSHARRIMQRRYDANDHNSWLLGDASYPLEPYLMTPYHTASEGSAEALYNFKHAKARTMIEKTIQVLKNKFRCLLGTRPLHYRPAKATKIVNVCAALHNICIEYGAELKEISNNTEPYLDDIEENYDNESTQSNEAHQKREEIKNSFQ